MPKEYDPEDPMELVAVEIPTDEPNLVLDGIVQEYLLMGWSASQIMSLFRSPFYAATHNIYRSQGHTHVRRRVQQLADQWNDGWMRQSGAASIVDTGGSNDAPGP
jgi:hypothetical protein